MDFRELQDRAELIRSKKARKHGEPRYEPLVPHESLKDNASQGKGWTHCNRKDCLDQLVKGVRWWNISTEYWYCQPCARRINAACKDPICIREDQI